MNISRICLLVSILIMTAVSCADSEDDMPGQKNVPPLAAYSQVKNTIELLDAVSHLNWTGGTIVLLPGNYEIKEPIVIRQSNVCIMGSGWSTIIKRIGEGDAVVFAGSLWNCAVKNLVIEGDPTAKTGSGIVFKDGEWSGINVVDYCNIRSFGESGIKFDGTPGKPMSSNTVSNCWFTGNLGDQLSSRNNNDFFFFTNQFGGGGDRIPRTGTLLENSGAGTYTMNYHWGNRVGLRLGPGARMNRIENNRIEQSRESGIVIGSPAVKSLNDLNIISGNTIHTNSETNFGKYSAVTAYDASEITFIGNQIFSWDSISVRHKNGIELVRCKNWIIKDNNIRHHTEKAIVYSKKDGHIVKDNIMDKDAKPESDKK